MRMAGAISVLIVALGVCAPAAGAQPGRGAADKPTHDVLTDYEGVYAYHGVTSISLVAADSIYFAVIDEARYPLRYLERDRFVNGAGDTIPFIALHLA